MRKKEKILQFNTYILWWSILLLFQLNDAKMKYFAVADALVMVRRMVFLPPPTEKTKIKQ